MTLAVRVTGDASQMRAEMLTAKGAIDQVGAAAQAAGAQAGAGFGKIDEGGRRAGEGGRRAGEGFRQFGAGADVANRSLVVTSNQMRQLAPQLNDIFTQLALGQSPLMILAAQGGQITQIFGGVRNTLGVIASALGVTGFAALGLVTGLTAIGLQAERQERALINTSQRLRATRDDYLAMGRSVEDVAERIARSTATSKDDARGAGLIIAAQRRFTGDAGELERLTRLSTDLARVMGVDAPAAAERFVARAIADPARAAREAADGGLRGFDEALVRTVQRLVASGQSGEATGRVLTGFGNAARGASGEMTGLQSAWTTLMNHIKNGLSDVGEASASAILRAYRAAYGAADRAGLTGPGFQRQLQERAVDPPPPSPRTPVDQAARQRLTAGTQHLRDAEAARAASEGRYNSVPGRPPIGSRYREPEWAAGLQPANGQLWSPGDGLSREMPGPLAAPPRRETDAERLARLRTPDGTRATQIGLLQTEIGTLEAARRGLDPRSPEAERYAEALEVLRARLEGLRDPIDETNRRSREQAGLFGVAAGAARELATAELEAREAARRAGRDAAGQDAAAAEARGTAQTRLNGQLNDAIQVLERERQGILATSTARHGNTEALREAQLAQEAHARAVQFGAEGSPAYEQALARITNQLRANKAAQDEVALGPLFQAQRREGSELERRRGLIGSSALERAQSDAEAAARERLRAAGRPVSGEAANAYVAEERARAENLLGMQRMEAGYQEIGRIGEQAFDRIGSAITTATVTGETRLQNLKNAGNAVASELTQAFLRLALINPVKNALGLGSGNATTLTDVIGGVSRWWGGAGTSAGSSAGSLAGTAMVSDGAGGLVAALHSGGIAGLEATFLKHAHPSLFAHARRFHTGGMPGLSAGEVPAILQRGEGVFTAEQMRAMAPVGAGGGRGGDVTFNVAFQGDAGSPEDRTTLIEGLRGMVRQEIGAAAPGIVNAASGQVAEMARRGGSFSREVGRR